MKRFLVDEYLRRRFKNWNFRMGNPVRQQELFYAGFRKTVGGTAVDRQTRVSRFQSWREFIRETPTRDYSFFQPIIERGLSGCPDAMFRGKPEHVLCSSGTTGAMKSVLCGAWHIGEIRGFQRDMAAAMTGYSPGFTGFVPRINVGNYGNFERRDGIKHSYISGLFNEAVPGILRKTTWPDVSTLRIPDWETRVIRILELTASKDIGMLSGTAPAVLNFITTVCELRGIPKITDLWPSLDSIIYTGIEIVQMREIINRYFERPPCYFGSYMATEGLLGFQDEASRNDEPMYRLAFDRNVYSFKRRSSRDCPPLAVDELESGGEYEVFISNHTGLTNYELGDVLRVAGDYPDQRFKILGRDKVLLNVAGERLSDAEIMEAFGRFRKHAGPSTQIDYFFVFPETLPDGRFRYCFAAILPGGCIDCPSGRQIDLDLRKASLVYDDLRNVGVVEEASLEPAPGYVGESYARSAVGGNAKIKYCFASRREFLEYFR